MLKPGAVVGIASVALNTDSAQRLLTGFAVEALIKAGWLKKGNTLTVDGRYIGMPCEQKRNWHSLSKLCDDADIALTSPEREILGKLSDCIKYQGRYPVARHWEHMEPIFYWSYKWDLAIARLVTRLWRQLEIPLRGIPIGGASLD